MENIDFLDVLATKVAEHLQPMISPQAAVKTEKVEESFFTTKELCSKLRISVATLYRHRQIGLIKPARYIGRTPFYSNESINNYLSNFNS